MTTATSILLRYADHIALWLAPRLSRLPPHVRASLATAVALALGATGVTITGDEAVVIATGAIYVLGGIVDAVVSWRARSIAARAAHKQKTVVIRPDVALLIAVAFGVAGCAHWSATLQRAGIEASAAGQIEYLQGRGVDGSGDITAEASATLSVCRDRRCVPLTVTVESTDGAHVVVCASAWRLTTCEVVP